MNEFPIRRNTVLLAAAVAVNSVTLQLVAAVSAITFALVTGKSSLLGLGPALFLVSSAATSFPAGKLMDRVGRVPVLAGGFLLGAIGASLTSLGAHLASGWVAIPGLVLIGAAGATGSLARAAAGDMYPPARRARGIAYVMFGAVVGAILGPVLFAGAVFRRSTSSLESLPLAWLTGAGMLLIALVIVVNIRPDPKRIAEALETGTSSAAFGPPEEFTPLRDLLARPGVVPAMLAGIVSYAVMVSVMNLTGYVVVQHHHHPPQVIFPIIGAHVLGMYLLMPAVGWIADRVGRPRTILSGLILIAASTSGLMWFESVIPIAILLFGLGVGWSFSFVAATTQLADLAAPWERGKLLGFNDLVASLTGATFVLLGGYVLSDFGVTALALSATVIPLVPVIVMLVRWRRAPVAGISQPVP
jgi:MFS family permease